MIHIVVEWVQLICLTFCIGVIVCRLWFLTPSMQEEFSYQGNFVPALWNLFCYGLAVLIGCALVGLIARSMEMSGQPVSKISAVLPLVLFKTHYGTVWLVRIGALVLLAAAKTVVRYRDRLLFLILMLVIALVVSMTSSASGHGSDAGDFSVPEIMDWIHLIAACLWGGGLMVLSFSVLPDLIGRNLGAAPLISRTAQRFSALAGAAVALIVITAIYNFWAYVRGVSEMAGSPYGLAVAVKILLLLVLLNLGGFNRYVSVPLLQEWAGEAPEFKGAIDRIAGKFFSSFRRNQSGPLNALRFKRLVGFETALILAVLLCAAVLRHEVPARHAAMMRQGTGQPTQPNMEMDMDHHGHE